jgi:DNA-binding Lrp family transcriptional regulator
MQKPDVDLIRELQKGFKLERRPFLRLAKDLNLTEEQVIARLQTLLKDGVIRRIGVAVKPEKAGYSCNALVAWQVRSELVEEVGRMMADIPEISHCYERGCPPGWPYNLYTMIHCTSCDHMNDIISNLQHKFGLTEYRVFKTAQELKKISMQYFAEAEQ